MKIVIDTNLVVSAIFFGGMPEKLIDLLIDGRFDAYTNGVIIEEYDDTVEKLKKDYPDKTERFALPDIISKMYQIDVTTEVHVCRDPDDDKFIGCAIDSKSKYIVSGDKDLLAVGKHKDVEIVTVGDFLRENFPEE
ncbi:MAG: putative toxin-antitoxin system toxin component, PIN family [Eubacterium sp.]|nr:putative toxin-antitoxin system toxin component, PIN family [Eubacterium sp.]